MLPANSVSLVSSIIVQVAVALLPGITRLLNDEGVLRFRLKVSISSAILSFVTGTSTMVFSAPIGKVAVIGVEV